MNKIPPVKLKEVTNKCHDKITGQRDASEELKHAHLLLEAGIESPRDMLILAIDQKYNYLFFNNTHKNNTKQNYGIDLAVGMNLLENIPNSDDCRKAKLNFDRAFSGEGFTIIQEYGDINRVYYEIVYSPITDKTGKIIGATAFASDITERKNAEDAVRKYSDRLEEMVEERTTELTNANVILQKEFTERKKAEEALKESNARLQISLRASNIGLWDWNLKTNDVYFSPEWKKQIGYEEDEIDSRYEEWETRLHSEDRDLVLSKLHDYLNGRSPDYALEFRFRHKNGSYHWISVRGEMLDDTDGNPSSMMGCHIDITESKNLQEKLLQAQKIESIGTLAGGIAHDFNNILNSMLGHIYMAKKKLSGNGNAAGHLDFLETSANYATELVQQILTFSREGKQELKPTLVGPIIKEVANMLKISLPASINIQQKINPAGPVMADPTQIYQILMNLCTNACHAMLESGGILEIEFSELNIDSEFTIQCPALSEGPHVLLAVRDSGHGIDPLIINKIFEPYFTTKDKEKGTGLGLSVVHGIVRNCGGTVTVSSELSRGTTFQVYIPVIQNKSNNERRGEK